MPSNPWIRFGLLAFGVGVTLAANWIASRNRPPVQRGLRLLGRLTADLIWIVLIFVGGLIATRYIERIANPALGYLIFGLLAFAVSIVRSLLHQRSRGEIEPSKKLDRQDLLQMALHNLTYLLFAIAVYLTLSLVTKQPADPILFIPLCLGVLLPDLDSQNSLLGYLLPWISRPLESRFGHLQEWHTLAAAALVALTTAPLIPLASLQAWYLIPLGFLSHLIVDMLSPKGIMLLWPISRTRYCVFGGFVEAPGGVSERRLALALALGTVALLLVVDVGRPSPPPLPVPSYGQTVERYYNLRGRNLVFATVQGTWQATGRRIGGRFEILNAAGESFIMLDRFSGKVFTAGRSDDDDLYLNHITLQPGASAQTRAVEVHLQNQPLLEALPVVYLMQQEPGLQHIYVSGDVVVPRLQDGDGPTLPVDYAQTRLRKIQSPNPGHYTLHYLTASELIELANVQADTADLVVVATYVSPEGEPTPTPLPSPPPLSKDPLESTAPEKQMKEGTTR
jgi:inner membrane protein